MREFVKKCKIKVCDVVCPDKRQAFLNVSLSRNTVADRTCELATNLHEQLMERGKYHIAYSLAVDESSDTSGTAHLSTSSVEWTRVRALQRNFWD